MHLPKIHFPYVLVAALAFLLTACQSSNVIVDYDTDTDFSQFTHYRWQEALSGSDKEINPLISERTQQAIAAELLKASIMPAAKEDKADVLVRYYVSTQTRTQESNSRGSIGLGGSGSNVGMGISLSFPLGGSNVVQEAQIIVDLLNADSEQLKWRGSKNLSISEESPEQITAIINAAVAEIFSFYPPGTNTQ